MRALIPNLCTSLNLVFGMLSIFGTIRGEYEAAVLYIIFALAADGLDGRLARAFGVSSLLGKEMDSLCDLVSFGVAPAVLAYCYLLKDLGTFGTAAAAAFSLCGMYHLTN